MSSKPVLIVDWHDTLTEYSQPFLNWAEKHLGRSLKIEDIQKDFTNHGFVKEDFQAFEISDDFSFFPIVDSQKSIAKLSEVFRIEVISSSGSLAWHVGRLHLLYPEIRGFRYTQDKGRMISHLRDEQGLKIVGIVDDLEKNFKNLPPECKPICFKQPWNTDFQGLRGSWAEITGFLLESGEFSGTKDSLVRLRNNQPIS